MQGREFHLLPLQAILCLFCGSLQFTDKVLVRVHLVTLFMENGSQVSHLLLEVSHFLSSFQHRLARFSGCPPTPENSLWTQNFTSTSNTGP